MFRRGFTVDDLFIVDFCLLFTLNSSFPKNYKYFILVSLVLCYPPVSGTYNACSYVCIQLLCQRIHSLWFNTMRQRFVHKHWDLLMFFFSSSSLFGNEKTNLLISLLRVFMYVVLKVHNKLYSMLCYEQKYGFLSFHQVSFSLFIACTFIEASYM